MSDTVFWSWQNDLSSKTNREFIRSALEVAVDRVSQELDVEEVERIELDHDTKSTVGMADIGQTILEKIGRCAILVADVTPISRNDQGKHLPNPNVMIELGYGLHALSYERIIAILNTAYGSRVEDLPFDIRHRRIMTYQLSEDATQSDRKTVRETLIGELVSAIKMNLKGAREERASSVPIAGTESYPGSPGIWKANWPTKIAGSFGAITEVMPDFVPRSWVRIIPERYVNGLPPMSLLNDLPDGVRLWAPYGGGSSGNFGPCEFGFLTYWISGDDDEGLDTALNMAAFIEDTGEIWSTIGTAFDSRGDTPFISYAHLLSRWATSITQGMALLDHLGASKRRRLILGIDGMTDAIWHSQSGYVPGRSRKSELLSDQTEMEWTEDKQIDFLYSFWNRLRDAFNVEQVSKSNFLDYYNIRRQSQ